MNKNVDYSEDYKNGYNDAFHGREKSSNHPDYQRGYEDMVIDLENEEFDF